MCGILLFLGRNFESLNLLLQQHLLYVAYQAGGGKRLHGGLSQPDDSSTLLQFFYSIAAAGGKFQSGIVRCRKEYWPSEVLIALRCL